MTTEQDLQSLLLRLSVLVASSLNTLSDPLPPTIIDPSSSSTYSAAKLSAQILNDVFQLLTAVQKCCTNLTLALKPNKSVKQAPQVTNFTPTDGLDTASLDAARAQLDDLTKEHIPKITFLARKASSEASVYRYIAKTEEDLRKEKEERELIMSKGGHIVQQSHSREKEKLEKIKRMGLGIAWSKAIVSDIVELLGALGELSETFMSERTLLVLQKASEARAKASNQQFISAAPVRSPAKTREDGRQRALQATSRVWNICDTALKGKLPDDNRIAVRSNWKARTDILEDALEEFAKFVGTWRGNGDSEPSRKEEEESEEDWEEDEDFRPPSLTQQGLADRGMFEPLLKAGCQLHAKAGELYLSKKIVKSIESIDLDELDEAGDALSEALDELVSAMLYGGREDDEDLGEGQPEAFKAFQRAVQRLYLRAASFNSDDNLEPIHLEFAKKSEELERKFGLAA